MARKKTGEPDAVLLYADSEGSADQLYLARCFVPDPFVSFVVEGRTIALLSALEIVRVRRDSAFDEVLSLEEWRERAKKRSRKGTGIGMADVVAAFAADRKLKRFRVSRNFPFGLACELRERGFGLEAASDGLFPQRERKTDVEARLIRRANACGAAGIRAAEAVLRESSVRQGKLRYRGRPLTSEHLKEAIETACLREGGVAAHTIAAGGDQACDPHCSGSGPLRAGELIIVDVFPRMKESGYYGDMTRTFLKGKPSDRQRELVAAVKTAQKEVVTAVKAGASAPALHRRVLDRFERLGFSTGEENGEPFGFFHGTGHGLGLELHEAPRISLHGPRLKNGHVVTVEPGLYYPGLGGVRIEDVVRVTGDGSEKLSRYHYRWVIP